MTSFDSIDVLKRAKLATSTLKLYSSAFEKLKNYAKLTFGVDITTFGPSDYQLLDRIVSLFMVKVYLHGEPKSWAKDSVFASEFFFGVKLHSARDRWVGFSRLRPSVSWLPLPWDLTFLLIIKSVLIGDVQMASAILLAFSAFLRVGELVHLRIADVRFPSKSNFPISLRLRTSKTGLNAHREVRHHPFKQLCEMLLSRYLNDRKRMLMSSGAQGNVNEQLLFPFDDRVFRQKFKFLLITLGLYNPRLTPHSLRHGAASHAKQIGFSLTDIKTMGGWSSDKAARTYIHNVPAKLTELSLPLGTLRLAAALESRPYESLQEAWNRACPRATPLLLPQPASLSSSSSSLSLRRR